MGRGPANAKAPNAAGTLGAVFGEIARGENLNSGRLISFSLVPYLPQENSNHKDQEYDRPLQ